MRLKTTVYRAHNPRWAFQPNTGDGAARYGGRFNPLGVKTLYTSLRVETAWLEAQQGFPFKAQPMTICAYDVDCDMMVDLTDAIILESLGISKSDLTCPWEKLAAGKTMPPSWKLAQHLIDDGKAGILVRSFSPGAIDRDVNAVFWRWSDTLPHKVTVIDNLDRLPKDDASWR